jgi:hemolysin activation/secretion protein
MLNGGITVNTIPFLGSSTSLNYTQATHFNEYFNLSLQHSYLWSSGFSLNASYALSESRKPDTEFSRLFDQSTKSETFTIGASYFWIRSRNLNVSTDLSFTHRNSEVNLLDSPYTEERIRFFDFSINTDFSDELGGVTQIIPSFTQGLNINNATNFDVNSSRPLAPADFNKANLYISRNQQLVADLSLFFSGSFQYAFNDLPSYATFSFGGTQYGRGYDPGSLEDDHGAAGSVELRFTQYYTETALQPFLFGDVGKVWPKTKFDGEAKQETLSSMGLGFRFWGELNDQFISKFSIEAFGAKPLKTYNDSSYPRFIIIARLEF